MLWVDIMIGIVKLLRIYIIVYVTNMYRFDINIYRVRFSLIDSSLMNKY